MPSSRLQLQFERLFEYFKGEDRLVYSEEITEALYCTQRNARIVLNKLEQQGWIEWIPAAGRGKQSQLIFKRNKQDVIENLAKRYIEESNFSQALSVLNEDHEHLMRLLVDYFSLRYHQDRPLEQKTNEVDEEEPQEIGDTDHVIRLAHYGYLDIFDPLDPKNKAQIAIVDFLLSGLTRIDKQGKLQPDLAYRWQMISPTHWQFFIRPNLKTSQGEPLSLKTIICSLQALKSLRLFAHIDNVLCVQGNILDVYLTQPDLIFDKRLARTEAKMVPPAVSVKNTSKEIGETQKDKTLVKEIRFTTTGAFELCYHDKNKLILKANPYYYGQLPLVERIEIIAVEKDDVPLVYPAVLEAYQSKHCLAQSAHLKHSIAQIGSLYLIVDKNSDLSADMQLFVYFRYILTANSLILTTNEKAGLLPAYGLLPGQYQSMMSETNGMDDAQFDQQFLHRKESKQKQVIYLMYPSYDLRAEQLAVALAKLCKPYQIDIKLVTEDESAQRADLSIASILPDELTDHTWFENMMAGSTRLSMLSHELIESTFAKYTNWQAKAEPFPSEEMADLLVRTEQVIPLCHFWHSSNMSYAGALEAATMDAIKWWDLDDLGV